MNNKRRERLKNALGLLNTAYSIIDGACSEEQDKLDNIPENLQESDRYSSMESAVDNLSDALDRIDEAKENIQSAISK